MGRVEDQPAVTHTKTKWNSDSRDSTYDYRRRSTFEWSTFSRPLPNIATATRGTLARAYLNSNLINKDNLLSTESTRVIKKFNINPNSCLKIILIPAQLMRKIKPTTFNSSWRFVLVKRSHYMFCWPAVIARVHFYYHKSFIHSY